MIAATLGRGALRLTPVPAAVNAIVFDGDSLITGVHGGGTSVAAKVSAILRESTATDVAVAAQTLTDMNADASTEVDALYDADNTRNICVVWGGTNDLYDGATAATTISRLETYCNARQSAGWTVAVVTMLPRSNTGTPAGFETDRGTVNSSIRANYATYADVLVDVAADSRIGDAGDETNTTYYSGDDVHLNDYGRHVVAHLMLDALAATGIA